MNNNKIWFVTGASKGLGLTLVKRLLKQGFKVAATSRNIADLETAVGSTSADFLPLAVNIKSEESVQQAIEKTIGAFGKIDVLVNNAGYGLLGGIEEISDAEARDNFDVNVFGLLNVTRNVLPHLRQQKSGYIINISSIGGFNGEYPGGGIYCSTKFAVNGLTEALAAEGKPFGINVTIVQPGLFRTNFLSEGSLVTPKNPLDEYQNVRELISSFNQYDKQQPGDPEKAATAMIRITTEVNPPLNLFLGPDAYELAHKKLTLVNSELETWKELTTSTGF
jgi:NAD(P)-dependent dehydrogenase (short-subunit alcohol dehydrogenase family)